MRSAGRVWREGGACDHMEAVWSKASKIRDLPPPPTVVWKGLRFELSHKEERN